MSELGGKGSEGTLSHGTRKVGDTYAVATPLGKFPLKEKVLVTDR